MNASDGQVQIVSTQDIISPSMLRRWTVVMSGALLFLYSFMQLNILNPIGIYLMRDFGINSTQLGYLSSMHFYANFLLVFPAGLLVDRFSTRRFILMAMGCAVISMFGFAYSSSIWMAGFFRFLSGIGGAFCFVTCIRLASQWFPPAKMGLAIGVIISMCAFGGMLAQAPMSLLSTAFGWRHAMLVMGGVGILFTFIIWLTVEDKPSDYQDVTEVGERKLEFWESIRVVLSNRYNWLGGAYISLMNLPVFILGALWGNLFLTQAKGLTTAQASNTISMLFVGTLLGAPLSGWISTSCGRRRLPMIIGAGLALIIISGIIYIPHLSPSLFLFLFLLLGLAVSTQSLGYPVIMELNSPQVTASANSIIATVLMVSGFIFQPLFGWLINLNWDHKMVGGEPIYSLHNFHLAMLILPFGFIASKLIMPFIKETYCQLQYQQKD